jgi:hypothetical protein
MRDTIFSHHSGRALFVGCLFFSALSVQGAIRVGNWVPIFKGIEYATGEADAAEPRLQKVFAIRIDLHAPGIEFITTPANGEKPLETTSETASEFLVRHHLQVAINANFFEPCCDPGEKNLRGLAISRGEIVSPPLLHGRCSSVLLITRDNVATITTMESPIPLDHYWTAVAGSERVLIAGVKPGFPDGHFHSGEHPRSAVGITKDGRFLILLAIDGRQLGYSIGATMTDVADWLLRFGAYDGLNLDGGGSTALVRADGERALVLNHPSGPAKPFGDDRDLHVPHGEQRSNGNHLGVYAKPLDVGRVPTR